ncbi:MAG: ankyrin repeat domain-containing protein [Endozoicomonadaceae bacterium]|nr:ankyrin repeat domain-containing protein [Endozoicomonadaceae bacterium]
MANISKRKKHVGKINTELTDAVRAGGLYRVQELIVESKLALGDDLNLFGLITCAIYYDLSEICQYLVTQVSDKDMINDALIYAVENNKYEMVQLLLGQGADPRVKKGNALFLAAEQGLNSMVELLIRAGGDVDCNNGFPLRAALGNDHISTVQLLLNHNADVSTWGFNSLIFALEMNKLDIAFLLIKSLEKSLRDDFEGVLDFAYPAVVQQAYYEVKNCIELNKELVPLANEVLLSNTNEPTSCDNIDNDNSL